MKITADFKRLHSGENESRTLTVEKGDEYEALSGKLALITPMGRIYISDELSFSEGRAEYPIPAMLLDGKGELIVQLVLYNDGGFTVKSPVERYPVFASVDMMDLPECTDAKLMSLIEIIDELMNKSDIGHIHGDIYFTKDEIHSLLKGKSDTSHLHEGVYLTETQLRGLLPEIPGTVFEHNHDGRYYTREFVDKALSDINAQQASVQDTVVEQGTDGVWNYRKWASGIAECWGVTTIKFNTAMASNGNYAVTGEMITVTLPDNLFKQSPVISLTPMGGGYSDINIGNIYNTHFTVSFRTEWAATDMPNWVQCICYGRWK